MKTRLSLASMPLTSTKVLLWLLASVGVAWEASNSSLSLPHAIASAPHYVAQSASNLTLEPASTAGQPTSAGDLAIANLTNDQSAQIELIFEEYQPQIEAALLTYQDAEADLIDLLQLTTPEADLIAAREAALEAERAAEDLIFERNLALRRVLTLDQRQAINPLPAHRAGAIGGI